MARAQGPGSKLNHHAPPARAHFGPESRETTVAMWIIGRAVRGFQGQNAPRPLGILQKSAIATLILLERGPPFLRRIALRWRILC
jgi:hypothetical protein